MARTNNLTNFLIDIASAIKTKKGSETDIPASQFDTEILALPSQGTYQTKSVTIYANGTTTVTPDTGYDAIEELDITVQVPDIPLQNDKSISITSNTSGIEILPDTGYNGFRKLTLSVNVEGGGGDDPAVNAILWNILGYDQGVFNILKRVIPIEATFTSIGGTDDELFSELSEILEGGNE